MCGKNKPYSHSVSFVTQSECLIDTNIAILEAAAMVARNDERKEKETVFFFVIHRKLTFDYIYHRYEIGLEMEHTFSKSN